MFKPPLYRGGKEVIIENLDYAVIDEETYYLDEALYIYDKMLQEGEIDRAEHTAKCKAAWADFDYESR